MKRLALLALTAGLAAQPLCAQTPQAQTAPTQTGAAKPSDTESSAQRMQQFTSCVAEKEPAMAAGLLSTLHWDQSDATVEQVVDMLQTDPACKIGAEEDMPVTPAVLRGSLAAATFLHAHEGQALPDYSTVPTVFNQTFLDGTDAAHKGRIALLAFGECVFRNDTEEARKLLEAAPGSGEEGQAVGALNTYFGPCLPVQEGTQMKFSLMSLKGLIGEAAYAVDSSRQTSAATSGEAAN